METEQQDSGLRLNQVHKYVRVPGTQEMRLMKVSPVVRICKGTDPPLFIQEGKVYAEGGDEIPKEKLPGWFHDQVKLMTVQARSEIGYRLPDDPRPRLPGEQQGEKFYLRDGKFYNEDGQEMPSLKLNIPQELGDKVEEGKIPEEQRSVPAGQPYGEKTKMWTCPIQTCAKEMPLRMKGTHKIAHIRADKKTQKTE